ncbi:hypothetical protein AAU61_18590 [Desulfocarbo indianensis]|nr:hypothetical protein AAU61_18590 [Desulfocarbo indianensis]
MKISLTAIILSMTLLLAASAGAAGWGDTVYYVDRVSLVEGVLTVEFQGGESITYRGYDTGVYAYLATQAMAQNLPVRPWYNDAGQITGVRTWKP